MATLERQSLSGVFDRVVPSFVENAFEERGLTEAVALENEGERKLR